MKGGLGFIQKVYIPQIYMTILLYIGMGQNNNFALDVFYALLFLMWMCKYVDIKVTFINIYMNWASQITENCH